MFIQTYGDVTVDNQLYFLFRYRLEDYEGKMLTEAESIRHKLPPFISPYTYKDWGTGVS